MPVVLLPCRTSDLAKGLKTAQIIGPAQPSFMGNRSWLPRAWSALLFRGAVHSRARDHVAIAMMNWVYMWFKDGGKITREVDADAATTLILEGIKSVR